MSTDETAREILADELAQAVDHLGGRLDACKRSPEGIPQSLTDHAIELVLAAYAERGRELEKLREIAEMWRSVRVVDEATDGEVRRRWPGLAAGLDRLVHEDEGGRPMSEIIETGWLAKIPVGTRVEVVGESQVCIVDVAPVDWPARFRDAADAAGFAGYEAAFDTLKRVSLWLETVSPDVVEAIGRALLGEQP